MPRLPGPGYNGVKYDDIQAYLHEHPLRERDRVDDTVDCRDFQVRPVFRSEPGSVHVWGCGMERSVSPVAGDTE